MPISLIRFEDCPAKSFHGKDGRIIPGRSVQEHCLIVGRVAEALLARLPSSFVSSLFPDGAPLVAAAHDVGKISPFFYEKLRKVCLLDRPKLPGINPELEHLWGGHAGVSRAAALQAGISRPVAEVLGKHHGFTPPSGRLGTDENFGGEVWQRERERLLAALKEAFACDWPTTLSNAQMLALAGLVTVADWIGSGEHFEDPQEEWQGCIDGALDSAGFLPVQVREGLSFRDIFGFEPFPVQARFVEQIIGEGVYVLEAPMGLGKTEAALYAAYRALAQNLGQGIYFALPTQLTSNKLHERFKKFLEAILTADSPHRALLLHGHAHLVDMEMGEEGAPGGAWFHQRKRGLLAPFAVGTLDQALMAAMNVKHGFVRAFGLAGKVVILDEVHTYDAYTGTILDALVRLLRQLHCTVIILSATLNHARRMELLPQAPLQSRDYPLITAWADGSVLREIAVSSERRQHVVIRQTGDISLAIEAALCRAEAGQQVLWIENTVNEAQERYLDLAARAAELNLECGLLHSRYTQADREKNENKWVTCFGKEGWERRSERGRLLVGTQVLEQSLDIDADFFISRFAPTDMLLQRLGRLWRHADTPRPPGACCEAWLIVPELEAATANPYTAFGKSAYVYSPYVLCRSLEVWRAISEIDLPADIRGLIEATYLDRKEQTEEMQRLLQELENGSKRPQRKGRAALRQLARVALATAGKTQAEAKAETRYSEQESVDVLLLRAFLPDGVRKETRLTLLSGEQIALPWKRYSLGKKDWKRLAVRLMRQQLKVSLRHAPESLQKRDLERWGFQHCFYLGDLRFEEALLRVACVDPESDALVCLQAGGLVNEKYILDYSDDIGYRAQRN